MNVRQIRKLRAKFEEWRAYVGTPNALLSIEGVILKIGASDFAEGKDITFLDKEALRRFAAGEATPYLKRLELLRDYLIHTGFVKATEFEDIMGDDGEMYSVSGYLAGKNGANKRLIAELHGGFFTHPYDLPDTRFVEIEIISVPNDNLFHAYEHIRLLSPAWGEDRLGKISGIPIRTVGTRVGYGFISTADHAIHIFLRAGSHHERVHYVERVAADQKSYVNKLRDGEEVFRLEFMRVGGSSDHLTPLPESPASPSLIFFRQKARQDSSDITASMDA